MNQDKLQRLKLILAEKAPHINMETLSLEDSIQSLGVDSLDFVELIYEAETQFKMEIPTDELTNIKTVGDLVRLFNEPNLNKVVS